MTYLLRVDSSVSGERSFSNQVANTFQDAWPGAVVLRDLAVNPVAHLDAAGVSSRVTEPGQRSEAEEAAAAVQDELVAEFLGASAYLFAVPMYNYTMPSVFKAWLDHIMIVDQTIGLGPHAAPTTGRPAVVISARGGGYGPGAPQHGKDFLIPTVSAILSDPQLMGLRVHTITPELTYAKVVDQLRPLLAQHERSLLDAHRQAEALAADLARGGIARTDRGRAAVETVR
ncbi:NAD(P)H-dependent oxidoreductase [Frankia sp. Mgl5]|uniref:FMN-dependent NADH-azoreductase n=1 Tax=Frankia sp. Mgl5 TaxID=2933793 RepID=UPI00200BAEDF|nr:NAD(P)H-dependent oxidoreductase [Frankia sp. Mgl5]MCK9928272.1 NAD(P)H-dependent oxidoreductase [Frankia sp. Mgl5]